MNQKNTLSNRILSSIERIGNALPHPVALFSAFTLGIVLLSSICSALGVSATGELIVDQTLKETTVFTLNLLTPEGISYMLTSAVENFTSYAPLGTVLVVMLGVGVAEQSGLIHILLKYAVKLTPAKLITPMIVFLGVLSNIASDAGYVILLPLGAMIFRAYGRHPLAGLAAAFSGVSGGFSANLLIGTIDPLLAGITQSAVSIIDPNYEVSIMGNYYFLFASTFLITFLGTFITDRIVEPRLGIYKEELQSEENLTLTDISSCEQKGLRNAGLTAFLYIALIFLPLLLSESFLQNANGIVLLITFLFMLPGIAFGKTTGAFAKGHGVCEAMVNSMSSMGSFLALSFVSAQFINYFNYTKLGTIIALTGANFFQRINIGLLPLLVTFILFSAFMNIFMGSASAKWSILAPVFVPMFMLLGYSPELCQLAYRIGDSCTNVITPMMTYYTVILTFAQKYDKNAGVGTLTATMLPYSICFLLCWTLLLIAWISFGIPIGIGVN